MIVGTWYGNSNPNMYYAKRSISLLLLLLRCQGPALWDPMDWKYHRAPCPSSSLGVFPSSSTLSQWCHPTILSSVIPFSTCLQSFPASGSFPVSWLFTSGCQSIGALSIMPSNEYSGLISFRIDWFDLLVCTAAAAAKLLQSWPTLCDPIDRLPRP